MSIHLLVILSPGSVWAQLHPLLLLLAKSFSLFHRLRPTVQVGKKFFFQPLYEDAQLSLATTAVAVSMHFTFRRLSV